MESLDLIKAESSGCQSFDRDKFKDYYQICLEEEKKYKHRYSETFRKFLLLFILEKFSDFKAQINERPDLLAEKEIKALYTYVLLIREEELAANHFLSNFSSPYARRRLSQGISRAMIEILSMLQNLLFSDKIQEKLQGLNLFSLKEKIPDIVFYYGDYILRNSLSEKYPDLEDELLNFTFIDICDGVEEIEARLSAERVRLLAFLYRRTGDSERAEKYMLEYRGKIPQDIQSTLSPEIRTIENRRVFPANKILDNWADILQDCDEAQQEVLKLTGIYQDTCSYYKCDDCCNYTSPHMSLTEYRFLLKWAEENNYSLDIVREKARKIQAEHQQLFGEKLKIIDTKAKENQEKGSENPFNFKYSCPFLIDGRCSIYHARPLLCRGFGLSSDDALAIKTCNFYSNQYIHNCSRDNERYVYDMRPVQAMAKASDRFITKQESSNEQQLKGTIVAWLSEVT